MAIELDIEDIVGSGCASSIGRAVGALSCLWMGAATGVLALVLGSSAGEALSGNPPELGKLLGAVLAGVAWGPLLIFRGMFIPFFFPLILIVYFRFARGDGGTLRFWVAFAALTGLLVLLSHGSWAGRGFLESALVVVLWLGFAGSLAMLGFLFVLWQRRRLADHLHTVAGENSDRRRLIAEEFGTAVGDREFATGDHEVWTAPPDPKANHPVVPRPAARRAEGRDQR